MIVHTYSTQGNRSYQEDAFVVKRNLNTSNCLMSETENMTKLNVDLIGVFDGHGGGEISKTLCKILPQYFYKHNFMSKNIPKPSLKYNSYIIDIFSTIQNELNASNNYSTSQGSTVCMCIIYIYNNKKYLTAFWTGDSRAISCDNNLIAQSLTLDHKPDSPLELRRIKKLGGFVTFEPNDVPRIQGILAVSRSLGDFDIKQFIEHKPDIAHYICNQKFIVVATDGLWDVMNNQMVVDFILNNIFDTPNILLTDRVNKSDLNIAYKLAMKAIELGSDDNISIIVYFIDSNF